MDGVDEVEEHIRQVTAGHADLETRDHTEASLLHYAVARDRVELVEMLLERGANVNAADSLGQTPLFIALTRPRAGELLALLMKRGVDILAKDVFGQNALYWLTASSAKDAVDVARTFLEMGVSPHEGDMNECLPLHWATVRGKYDLVKLFLDHGVNVNAQTMLGESPLHFAIEIFGGHDDSTQMLKILLERGANVHLKSIDGRTALHNACLFFHKDNVKLLLSAGADVLAEDCDGKTPLAITHERKNMENPNIGLMIKMLALKKFCQPSIELKDERIIEQYPKLRDYYRECHAHLSRMKFTRFAKSCTFFELLAKSRDQIAALMRNPDFEANFELYDLSRFSMYAEDLLEAFEHAQRKHRFMRERENAINEAVYHVLPDVVVRRVVCYLWECFKEHVL